MQSRRDPADNGRPSSAPAGHGPAAPVAISSTTALPGRRTGRLLGAAAALALVGTALSFTARPDGLSVETATDAGDRAPTTIAGPDHLDQPDTAGGPPPVLWVDDGSDTSTGTGTELGTDTTTGSDPDPSVDPSTAPTDAPADPGPEASLGEGGADPGVDPGSGEAGAARAAPNPARSNSAGPLPTDRYPPSAAVYSTLDAPAHMLRWMDSDALIFNRRLPADTPKLSNSATIARNIDDIVRGRRLYSYGSGIEDTGNAPYMILVDSEREPFTQVRFRPQFCNAQKWWNWTAPEFDALLNGAYPDLDRWGIPFPADFRMQAHDNDYHLMVYDWRRDILFELWKARTPNLTGRSGVEACWGGVIKDFSHSSPGIFPFPTGADAAGLTAPGLTITLADIQRGRIDHAIGVSTELVMNNFDNASHSYPANRNDGQCTRATDRATARMRQVAAAVGGAQNCLFEGQYLRFPADMDVSGIANPVARMIAEAGRDYGFVVHDVAGCFCIQAESGYPVTANGLGSDPWVPLYQGATDGQILAQIDWTRLEVLPPDWNRPSGYRIPCAIPPNRTADTGPNRGDPRCQVPGDPYLGR